MENKNDSVRKDTTVVSATKGPKVENEKIENYPRKKGPRGRSLSDKLARKTCQDYMHGKCTKPSCDFWYFSEGQHYKKPSGCRFGDKCVFLHKEADGQPSKKQKKQCGEGAVAFLKNSRQLGCVFQDVETPKFSSILQKSTTVSRPTHIVQFSKNTLRHIKIRENKGPSSGVIQRTSPHERSPYAPQLEDRSQEKTKRQDRCARGDAWRMSKGVLNHKEQNKATFFSHTEVWCLPAPSVTKPEETEFVVDSRASMHMLSRKDLNSDELDTVRFPKNPITAVTANGEVQTQEEATVYVEELDLFVTVKLLDDTPTVLSLGELCEDHGYSCKWTSGQLPHLNKNDRKYNAIQRTTCRSLSQDYQPLHPA